MGFSGLWRGVLRVILRWRRGAYGRFCRGIPGFLSGVRVRRGDSAHGGHGRANWAKNFLKIFKKGAKNPKIGVWEGSEGGLSTPYIGCAGRFLSLNARPLAALLKVRFVQAPQLQAPPMRSQGFTPLIYREPVRKLHRPLYGVSPLVRPTIP